MANTYFKFKKFIIHQEKAAMKIGTDGVLLGAWADCNTKERILDIGTGTGLIAIMMAQRFKNIVDAVEIDEDSYFQAKENITGCQWSERINVYKLSFQKYAKIANHKYGCVVCNPPFFIDSLKTADDSRNLARHNDQLSFTDLLEGANDLMVEEGVFNIILPYLESAMFIAEAANYGLFCIRKMNILPVPGAKVKRVMMSFSKKEKPLIEESIVIENFKRHEYSDEYKNLTKDFYLNF